MKVGDVFVVFDNRGEQCRITVAKVRRDHVVVEGVTGDKRWFGLNGGPLLTTCKVDEHGHRSYAMPAAQWDERLGVNAARAVVNVAIQSDEMALYLAECVRAKAGCGGAK